MEEIKVRAEISELDKVIDFIEEQLDKIDCNMKIRMQLNIAVEEIFVNIAHYAYPDDNGTAIIRYDFGLETNTITICFLDMGTPYDPLARKEPDITLSAEERSIGGLGILMVKKSMDHIEYAYRDGYNMLTIQKKC